MNLSKNRGVSALPMLLLVSAIIAEIAVVSVVVANVLSSTRLSERLGSEAFAAARAGAQDATLRVIRYKNCPNTSGCPVTSTLIVGSRSADVTITNEGGGIILVDSVGDALGRKKRVQATLDADPSTGEVLLQSFEEVPI